MATKICFTDIQATLDVTPFYFPSEINEFEWHKGKYYWLDETRLQILREYNGQLVKSVAVKANNFTFDSSDNVVLVNHATKEINVFTVDGILMDQIPLDNYIAGLGISLTKDDQPLFYSLVTQVAKDGEFLHNTDAAVFVN